MIKKAFIFAFMLSLFVAISVFSNSVGFNYSQAVNDVSWGVFGDYERDVGQVDLSFEGQVQRGDDYVGNVDASAQFNVKAIGVKLSSLNQLQGPTLNGLGRQNTIDLALVVPIESVDVAVGVFGASRNPFAPRYELSDPTDIDSAVVEAEAGITIPEGTLWGVSISAAFDVNRFEVGCRALLDPSNVTHQGVLDIGTEGQLYEDFDWTAAGKIRLQSNENIVELQSDLLVGIVYSF